MEHLQGTNDIQWREGEGGYKRREGGKVEGYRNERREREGIIQILLFDLFF